MNKSATADAARATHVRRSTPATVHWGYFDAALKPVLTIESGDRVVIESRRPSTASKASVHAVPAKCLVG